MVRYIAKKPCQFGGKKFYIGDEIPNEYVDEPSKMEKYGVISIDINGTPSTGDSMVETKIEVIVHSDNGDIAIYLTKDELSTFMDIRQLELKKSDEKQKIVEIIKSIESDDLLIALDAIDRRNFVAEEARKRAEELHQYDTEPDTETGGDG